MHHRERRMNFSWKTIAAFVIIWCALIMSWHFLIHWISDYQRKAQLLRLGFVIILQSFLSLVSITVWRVFSPLLYVLSKAQAQSLSRKSLRHHKNSDADLTQFKIDSQTEKRLTLWHCGLVVYIVLCHLSYFTNYFLISTEPHWFSMMCYICLGIHLQCFIGLALIRGMSLLFSVAKHGLSLQAIQAQSGISYKNIIRATIIYLSCASMLGLYTASQPPHVKQVNIPIKDLPKDLKDLHIIQLSDIHLGPTVGFSKLKMIVDIVKQQNPDLLVITGDLVDGSVESLKGASEPLQSIKPKYGKLFVTGNHEYYTGDVGNWLNFLRSMDFNVLHNSNVKIPREAPSGGQICFAGTDDLQADKIGYGPDHTFDFKKAIKGCDESLPIILLAHQPNAAQKALDFGTRLDLILSGHTHGGQIFPFMFGAYFLNSYFTGLYKVDNRDAYVYVSTGTQYWGIPMRIGTSMEITAITLRMS